MNNSIENEVEEKHFRVAIFGSARIKSDDSRYIEVYNLAKKMGENNFDIVTGGGPGLMEAANKGHRDGNKNNNSHSIGLTIELPFEAKANNHLDLTQHFGKFSDRLDHFMVLSNVAVIMPGGIGTCLEFFYTWQLMQVKHICSMPIILVGEMWAELIEWVKKWPLKNDLISQSDLANVNNVKDYEEACGIIMKANDIYRKEGDNYCLNYKKYKLN
ncbi:LOG family protein [Patescibacteria group bacterium]|nr:LOG family protein [Patescibacteria group bacterium]